MQAFIGAKLLGSKIAQPQSKPFEISDNRLSGFILRVQPSGMRSYYARFGRNRRVVLGNSDTLNPEEARELCEKVLGNVAHGNHPLHGIPGSEGMTLGVFISASYPTWVNASRPRTAANTLEKLHRYFRTWYPEPLSTITVERIESWKARRLSEGRSPSTVLRDDEATSVLRLWCEQSGDKGRVFEIATGFKTSWAKLLKRAGITRFRWHDLRQHFASRLVQRGVPLNTVRDLLGYSTVQMSLRYAHLAPDQRREAVAKLNEKPILALTLRLPWEGVATRCAYPFVKLVEREGIEPSTPAL